MSRPVREIPVTEARTHLSELVDQARYQGVAVVLTKHGRPYARLAPLDETGDAAKGTEHPGQGGQTGRAAGPAWPDGLAYRMVALAKLHRDFVARRLSDLGLYVGQELLLARMWEQDGLAQSELVSRLQVEPPTVAKMLQRMGAAGLVRRERDEHDARVSRVFLTQRGWALREPVEAIWRDAERRMVRGLTAGQSQILRELLGQAWPAEATPTGSSAERGRSSAPPSRAGGPGGKRRSRTGTRAGQ